MSHFQSKAFLTMAVFILAIVVGLLTASAAAQSVPPKLAPNQTNGEVGSNFFLFFASELAQHGSH